MSTSNPEGADRQRTSAGDIHRYIADRFQEGRTAEEVQKLLVSHGYPEAMATSLVEQVVDGKVGAGELGVRRFRDGGGGTQLQDELARLEKELLREAGRKNMLYGALWCIGGLAVTVISFAAASSGAGGGRYVLAWGAIIFGAIQFFRGAGQANS